MTALRKRIALDSFRTDGWFERIGQGVGSFQELCDIIGERFFAFSVIVGARVTALTIDRRNPDQTLVDFVIGPAEGDSEPETQRLMLADFRRRLVGALLAEDDADAPFPAQGEDAEAVQQCIGVRYLLLAPLYGYELTSLLFDNGEIEIEIAEDGVEETISLDTFRDRLHAHVRDELERASAGTRSAIDLSKVAEAETLAHQQEWMRVVSLLGSWPGPLAIFLRTPEGQLLAPEARALIAKGLGLLGTACVNLGEIEQAEEVFRIGIQYAQEGLAAAELFRRLGEALLSNDRPGEAIGPLRRAVAFGGTSTEILPTLARAFMQRGRYVAAFACLQEALVAGVPDTSMTEELRHVEEKLGPSLALWKTTFRPNA